jgi:hypothetical protein
MHCRCPSMHVAPFPPLAHQVCMSATAHTQQCLRSARLNVTVPCCSCRLREAHQHLRQRLGPYLTEASLNARLVLNLMTAWLVFDPAKATYVDWDAAMEAAEGLQQGQQPGAEGVTGSSSGGGGGGTSGSGEQNNGSSPSNGRVAAVQVAAEQLPASPQHEPRLRPANGPGNDNGGQLQGNALLQDLA